MRALFDGGRSLRRLRSFTRARVSRRHPLRGGDRRAILKKAGTKNPEPIGGKSLHQTCRRFSVCEIFANARHDRTTCRENDGQPDKRPQQDFFPYRNQHTEAPTMGKPRRADARQDIPTQGRRDAVRKPRPRTSSGERRWKRQRPSLTLDMMRGRHVAGDGRARA